MSSHEQLSFVDPEKDQQETARQYPIKGYTKLQRRGDIEIPPLTRIKFLRTRHEQEELFVSERHQQQDSLRPSIIQDTHPPHYIEFEDMPRYEERDRQGRYNFLMNPPP